MFTQTPTQGDLALLQDPVAQQLLQSTIPARLAYTWTDGTPRVIPIAFHWTGEEVVMGTPPDAPKVAALRANPAVALTIDSNEMPYKVLLIRGTTTLEEMEGVVPEYALATIRYMGEEQGRAWNAQIGAMSPRMTRIAMQPTWVGILDFETRFPSALAKRMGMG
jgi:nitroimidazol reductase NimA-like FMN-containing flavoprotein (pyridoxamine 5'-phosphate oxidase superfamily)